MTGAGRRLVGTACAGTDAPILGRITQPGDFHGRALGCEHGSEPRRFTDEA